MADKIDGLGSRPVQAGGGRVVYKVGNRPVSAVSEAGGTAASSVTITDSARSLIALERAVADTPQVNAARVAELRAAIESGKYTVDPHRIADRLVDLARELGAVAGSAR